MAVEHIESEALTADEAAKLLGISTRIVFALADQDPDFPPSVRLSPSKRTRRWIRAELLEYLTKRAERDVHPCHRRRES